MKRARNRLKPWSQVPENNKRLMEAVCEEIIAEYVLVAEYRTSSGVTTAPAEPVADSSKEELVIEIARELYDRFVMGGWEPQDAYPQIREWLRDSPSKEELKAECEMLREELCYHRDYWAEWNMRALTAQAQKEELKAALGRLAMTL